MNTNTNTTDLAKAWRSSYGLPESLADLNTEALIDAIEREATGPLGSYNPVAKVTCPHCGGIMEAYHAKVHVYTTEYRSAELAAEARGERVAD